MDSQIADRMSDGCLRIGGPSAGADNRVALARQHGKPVYFSLEELSAADQKK